MTRRLDVHTGRITKALSGFYYVTTKEGLTYQTRGRGVFRNQNISPYVGDYVEFTLDHNNEGTIQHILPRHNQLTRPQVMNVDVGCVICSAVEPTFSLKLLDRFLVQLEHHQIKPLIIVTKLDLLSGDIHQNLRSYQSYYRSIGYPFILAICIDDVKVVLQSVMTDQVALFMGQSGVGKSTLLNRLDSTLSLKTGETSRALGRGRHTTRHVELLPILGGWIADTPGFSSLELNDIEKEQLREYFPEMWERRAQCKFRGCLHHNEPKCAVKRDVAFGDILAERYTHYLELLEELTNRKPIY